MHDAEADFNSDGVMAACAVESNATNSGSVSGSYAGSVCNGNRDKQSAVWFFCGFHGFSVCQHGMLRHS